MADEFKPQTTAEGQGPAQPNEEGLDPSMPEGAKETEDAAEGSDLSSLNVAQLKERAKAVGVSGYSTMHKDELIAAIEEVEG